MRRGKKEEEEEEGEEEEERGNRRGHLDWTKRRGISFNKELIQRKLFESKIDKQI